MSLVIFRLPVCFVDYDPQEVGGDNEGKGGSVARNRYKGPTDKNQRGVGSRVGGGVLG